MNNNKLDSETLRSEIRQLANSGISIDTLIASGHDGGGSISGITGKINKYQIRDILQEEYVNRPDLLANFNHIMLWGCYTTTENEVNFWKSNFSNLDMIAGFLGSGPTDDKLASSTIIRDLIKNSDRLTALDDEANVRRELRKTIEHLHFTLPGIYLETGERCDNRGYYYSREARYDKNGNLLDSEEVHGSYDVGKLDCETVNVELAHYRAEFEEYYYGRKPIPNNTRIGLLRIIYNSYRENEHCLNYGQEFGDLLGLLLFYEGVVDNFLNTFKEDIEKLPREGESYLNRLMNELMPEIERRKSLISNPPDGMSSVDIQEIVNQLDSLIFFSKLE
jgi:hypothetical protein